jgi:hypothetical protein
VRYRTSVVVAARTLVPAKESVTFPLLRPQVCVRAPGFDRGASRR